MKRLLQLAIFLACFSLAAHATLPSCLDEFAPHNMTSDTAPSPYVASASSEQNGAWQSFSGVGDGKAWLGKNSGTDYLELDYGSSHAIQGYSMVAVTDVPGRSPKTWTFQGSPDGSAWTTLDTQTNAPAWSGGERRYYYFFGNATSYRYFKWNITANQNGGTYTGFDEGYLYYISQTGMCVLQNAHHAVHVIETPDTINTVTATLFVATIIQKGATPYTIGPPTTTPSTTWTPLTQYSNAGSSGVATQIFYAAAPTTDSAQTFNCNTHDAWCEFYIFRGTLATSDVYQVGSDHGAGCTSCLSLAAGLVTPKQTNALVVSAWGDDGIDISTINIPALTYNDVNTGNNLYAPNAGIAYTLNATTSPVNPTWTETVSLLNPDMAVAEAVFCSIAPCGGAYHRGYVVNSQ